MKTFLAVCVLACSTAALTAQSRAFVFGPSAQLEVSLSDGSNRPIAPPVAGGDVALDGGRWIAALTRDTNVAFASLHVWMPWNGTRLSFRGFPAGATTQDFPAVAGDDRSPRVFVWSGTAVTPLNSSVWGDIIRDVTPPLPRFGTAGRPSRLITFASVPGVVFLVRDNAGPELARYTETGQRLGAIRLPDAPLFLATSSDGSRAFAIFYGGSPFSAVLASYDIPSGMRLAETALLPPRSLGLTLSLTIDEAGRRVIVGNDDRIEVHDFDGLQLAQLIAYPQAATLCRFDFRVDESANALVVASTERRGSLFGGAQNPRISMVSLADGALVGSLPLAPAPDDGDRCGGGTVLLSPPVSPPKPEATLAATTITLRWPFMRNTTEYEILAGSSPAATTVVARTPANTVTFANVPAGTYYVRIRSINASGRSAPSAETRVVVP